VIALLALAIRPLQGRDEGGGGYPGFAPGTIFFGVAEAATGRGVNGMTPEGMTMVTTLTMMTEAAGPGGRRGVKGVG